MRRKGLWLFRWLMLLGVLALLLTPAAVLGRAGGGEGYSSGRSSRGWGSGGGGGDGIPIELVFHLVRLCYHRPAIGLPVAAIVIAFVVLSYKQGHTKYQGHVIRRGAVARNANRHAEALARIRSADPAFDESLFCGRVRAAFLKIQQSWSAQDLKSVRAFISDGIHERFSLQLQEQRELGYRNAMERVTVESAQIVELKSRGPFDVVTVRIDASAADYRVSLADGRTLSGSRQVQPFAEYWSFLRRHGVQTDPSRPTLIEGSCPNCGSSIEMNQWANCQHCGAFLRSGQYDWVLVEITQESEWAPSREEQIPGVERMAQVDPEFNMQHLEDRASVIFWRRAMAERKGNVQPLRKMATAEICENYRQRLAWQAGYLFHGECAVGAVDTIGVLRGDQVDRALVMIRWAGVRFIVGENGRAARTDHQLVTESLFVLARNAGVRTQADRAISSAHCPNCGAPESETASDACDFCGQVLNDGSRDWVLMDVHSILSAEARQLVEELRGRLNSNGHRELMPAADQLAWMVRASLVDGHLADAERKRLAQTAARHHVPPQRLEQLIVAAAQGSLDLPEPRDQDEARECLNGIVAMSLADGAIHRSEAALLEHVADRHGFSRHDLRMMINRQRSEMVSTARAEVRKRKANGRA